MLAGGITDGIGDALGGIGDSLGGGLGGVLDGLGDLGGQVGGAIDTWGKPISMLLNIGGAIKNLFFTRDEANDAAANYNR